MFAQFFEEFLMLIYNKNVFNPNANILVLIKMNNIHLFGYNSFCIK